MMKNIITCLLATLGLASACGQQHYEETDVNGFAELIANPDVIILDVRTAEEFKEGHIDGAVNIDIKQDDFLEKAKALLPLGKGEERNAGGNVAETRIAVYCRSGRRSANAARELSAEGCQCVNLKGGILAWKKAGKPVSADPYEVDVFKTKSGKTIKFHALMHASIRMEYDGKEIEIDPVAKLRDRVVDLASMPKADFIFVTHEHPDHYDEAALRLLSDEHTQLILNKPCADMFGSGKVMANGDKLQIADGFTAEAVPAYNHTDGHLQFHPKGRDNGYVLTVDGLRIYIAGDTEDIPEMEAVKDVDIAFLPCNQPYTMTVDQLVRAAKVIRPKVLFPYHYGETPLGNVPSLLQGEGIEVRIRHYE